MPDKKTIEEIIRETTESQKKRVEMQIEDGVRMVKCFGCGKTEIDPKGTHVCHVSYKETPDE